MSFQTKKNGLLNLGKEMSRFEMKSIVGGAQQTVCTGGTYNIGCSPGYCSGAGHGSFVKCQDTGGGTNPGGGDPPTSGGGRTNCSDGGSYNIGCSPGYCSGAGHGSFVSCS